MEKLSVAFPPLSLHKINPPKKQVGGMQAMVPPATSHLSVGYDEGIGHRGSFLQVDDGVAYGEYVVAEFNYAQ